MSTNCPHQKIAISKAPLPDDLPLSGSFIFLLGVGDQRCLLSGTKESKHSQSQNIVV